eukprot:CAMPEP_0197521246 /NCGR_PEP_ID=MMETSP1318-20131121/6528_1 /TAXON_ID=552666 /ORGANISM="Partenskyella glossopodia, Strain RCC365" /LENGTH=259 /DNA_ID=CAMNT_0043073143 /DNA_START=71 /DNA_END=850 /DNA_ORIENTATION=-
MALFFCAIVLAHYHSHNMSKNSKITLEYSIETFGFFSETCVFIVLGMTLIFSLLPSSEFAWSLPFVASGLLLTLLSRGVSILTLSFFLNLGLKRTISYEFQLIMWIAGLRGAVSFALSLQVPAESSRYIATTTLAIVILTTVFQGGLTGTLIRRLGLTNDKLSVAANKSKRHEEQSGRESTILCGACEDNVMSKTFGGMNRNNSNINQNFNESTHHRYYQQQQQQQSSTSIVEEESKQQHDAVDVVPSSPQDASFIGAA